MLCGRTRLWLPLLSARNVCLYPLIELYHCNERPLMIACCFTVVTRTGTPLATCSSVPPLPLWTPSPRPDVRDALERVAPRSTNSATNSKRFALETRSPLISFSSSSSSCSFSFQSTNQRRKNHSPRHERTAMKLKQQQPATGILLCYLFHSTPPFILQKKTKQNSAATGWNRDCVCVCNSNNNNNSLPSSSSSFLFVMAPT